MSAGNLITKRFRARSENAVLNNRLSGTLEVYQRKSKDLLFSRPLAPSLGFTAIDDNIGSLKNTGFEGIYFDVLVLLGFSIVLTSASIALFKRQI